MSWNASQVTGPMYHSTEREVEKDHFRKSETKEVGNGTRSVMALVADGSGTHVWVSSPIRGCVEGLLGRKVKSGTRATELTDENREDRSKSYIPWASPWCRGTVFYPLVDLRLSCLDTPAGLVEMRTTKEERDMTKEIYASWSAQNWHDPVSEAHELAMKTNQKNLDEQFFSPQERTLWNESDLKEMEAMTQDGCVFAFNLNGNTANIENIGLPCGVRALQNGTETTFSPKTDCITAGHLEPPNWNVQDRCCDNILGCSAGRGDD